MAESPGTPGLQISPNLVQWMTWIGDLVLENVKIHATLIRLMGPNLGLSYNRKLPSLTGPDWGPPMLKEFKKHLFLGRVETAGDCYIVSGGIMKQAVEGFGQSVEESHDPEESARRVMEFAKAILDVAGQVEMPNTQQPVRIRIGMHTGDV
eukprot:scaffold178437_cov15-Tisochrysis_lutea.AAC.1